MLTIYPEADLDIAATSASGNITMTGRTDEDGPTGPVTISTGALTFTYDANDLGALAMAPTVGDGEDDNYGDYSIAFTLVVLVSHTPKTKSQAITWLQ